MKKLRKKPKAKKQLPKTGKKNIPPVQSGNKRRFEQLIDDAIFGVKK